MYQALQGTAGLNIGNNGGPGQLTTFFMRGAESDHVLVLIDGIKVGSATSGLLQFETIPIDQIERIEIIRGPRSSLYGSEAVGGIIQIFTRKPQQDFQPNFSLAVGSENTAEVGLGVSGRNQDAWYSLHITEENSSGDNACTGSSTEFAGCFAEEKDDDGYNNTSYSLRGGYQLLPSLNVEANLLVLDSDSEFDGSFQNESEQKQRVYSVKADYSVSDTHQIRLQGGRNIDNSDNFFTGPFFRIFASAFESRRDLFTLENDIFFSDNAVLAFGYDLTNDVVGGSTDYVVTSRKNQGYFAELQLLVKQHEVMLSAREDDNEQYGSHRTGSIGWAYETSNAMRFYASYGSGFKAPTFNELYFPGFGNEDLEPERSISTEFGFGTGDAQFNWTISIYKTTFDDLITFDFDTFRSQNIGSAKMRGLELMTHAQLDEWRINVQASYMRAKNSEPGFNKGNILPRRARFSARVDIDRPYRGVDYGLTMISEGDRFDDLGNSRHLGGYTIFNARMAHQVDKHWLLQVAINNLFNKQYENVAYFPQADTNFMISARYQP